MKTQENSPLQLTRATGVKEPIDGITVPDLWHLAQALKDGTLTRNKTILAKAAEEVLECWYLAHDMKRHLQSPTSCD
jgi:hypothetical protein